MSTQTDNQDVSLREIILTIREYWQELWRKKWLIFLLCGLCVGAFVLVALLTKPKFPATVTFIVNEENSKGSSLSGLLGQFGFGGASDFNPDKILELSKSRRVAQQIYFEETTVNGKTDYLANHIIDYLESQKDWGKVGILTKILYGNDPLPIKGYRFKTDDVSSFGKLDNKAFKVLHIKLAGTPDGSRQGLVSTSNSDDSGIMSIVASTHRPELSATIANAIYEELSSYYIEKSVEKHQATYDIVKLKTDSIATALTSAQYNLASFQDKSQNIFRSTDKLQEQRLLVEIQKLMAMYGEAEKNLQLADFALKDNTPYIDVIDRPLLPLLADRPSIIQAIIKGLLLGLILSIGWIVGRLIIRNALSDA